MSFYAKCGCAMECYSVNISKRNEYKIFIMYHIRIFLVPSHCPYTAFSISAVAGGALASITAIEPLLNATNSR